MLHQKHTPQESLDTLKNIDSIFNIENWKWAVDWPVAAAHFMHTVVVQSF